MQDDTKQATAEEIIAKYTIKDSVFSDLFKIKKYLLQLYKTLHPEDVTATEDELTDITIRNVWHRPTMIILNAQTKTYTKARK